LIGWLDGKSKANAVETASTLAITLATNSFFIMDPPGHW
jgi:hypothetical protein